MKKIPCIRSLSVVLIAAFLATSAFSHEPESSESNMATMRLSIDPVWVMFGAYLPTFEAKVADRLSLVTFAGYVNTSLTINDRMQQNPYWAIAVAAGPRYYVTGEGLNGVFMESLFKFDYARTRTGLPVFDANNNLVSEATAYFLGNLFHVGFSWVCNSGLSFEAWLGTQIVVNWGRPAQITLDGNTVHRLGLRVGYAF